jgi:trans-aconitate 2-methyltransferase
MEKHTWNPALYDEKYDFVWKQAEDLVDLLAPKFQERVLDIGCGTGRLAHRIAASGAEVTGIDADAGMIEQARRNFPTVRFELADARSFHFPEPFDAIFSNAALHWIKEPGKAVARISASLKPGGRLVAEFGGKGNVREVVAAINAARSLLGFPEIHAPWYFPSIGEYAALLEAQGLSVTYAAVFDRPILLEGGEEGLRNWIFNFASNLLAPIPSDRHPDLIRHIEDQARPKLFKDGVWRVDYRRIRVFAVKE